LRRLWWVCGVCGEFEAFVVSLQQKNWLVMSGIQQILEPCSSKPSNQPTLRQLPLVTPA
jgi:hypothetical protein